MTIVQKDAVAAERVGEGWSVRLADGSRVEGAALALAQGNQAPEAPAFARGVDEKFFVNDPWSEEGANGDRQGGGDRRRRAADRHRPHHGRHGADAGRSAAPRPDHGRVASRPGTAAPCRPWHCAGHAGGAAHVVAAPVALAARPRRCGRLARSGG